MRRAVFSLALLSLTLGVLQSRPAYAATILVNDSSDALHSPGCATTGAGTCSLRDAITYANAQSGADSIHFSIGSGAVSIGVTAPLPTISETLTIDGTTQPGYAGSPLIEIDGQAAGAADGLRIVASSCQIRGLVVNRFSGNGIALSSPGSGHTLQQNFIGTNVPGLIARPNANSGIQIFNSSNNLIGGTTTADRNVISGNNGPEVAIGGAGSTGNRLEGNFIGTDATGNTAIAGSAGVFIASSSNVVGGTVPGARNVISGNTGDAGVRLQAVAAVGNQVIGNFIGTNAAGTAALGNYTGVMLEGSTDNIIGGTTPEARNVISGNVNSGVRLISGATRNVIQGNFIGLDASGIGALDNGLHGVHIDDSPSNIIGGTAPGAGNVISRNTNGLSVGFSAGNLIQGNLIGTDATGTMDRGNRDFGVYLTNSPNTLIGGSAPGARNVISGNDSRGIWIEFPSSTGNRVEGNYIGTDVTGSAALGNSADGILIWNAGPNTIGGTTPEARNVISGNLGKGIVIQFDASGNLVQGNFIGTNATGTAALPNVLAGVGVDAPGNTIGGGIPGSGNVISGNGTGVILGSGNVLQGNLIGTAADGVTPLGNMFEGVDMGFDSLVGGASPALGNQIAFNGIGIRVQSGTSNAILGNRIHSNDGLGIDLLPAGVTANDLCDADTGVNNLQNFPVLSGAASDISQTSISGTLGSSDSTSFRLEFFSSPACDASGYGEGAQFLGNVTVMTDPACQAVFRATFPVAVPPGHSVTATTTDPANNTSEFSACVPVTAVPGADFHTVPPCRLVDTRNPPGPDGGPALPAGGVRTFRLAGQCAIPPTARAISLNATVTDATNDGYLTFYPAGFPRPLSSNLNYRAGQTRANNALVLLGGAGEIEVFCFQLSGSAHLVIDVNGYFE